uniref:Uncharacterized protein n=1 Tax=Acrobeloides nanus TaxID=290746 RepID=A0A914DS58_9BILA
MNPASKNGFYVPLAIEEDFDIKNCNSEREHPLANILKITGLYFGEKKNGRFWYYLGILRALFFVSLSTYQTGMLAYLIFTRAQDQKTSLYIFIISWNIQATLSMMQVKNDSLSPTLVPTISSINDWT